MKILTNISDAAFGEKSIGFTIGNFDGVHSGHKDMLFSIRNVCDQKNYELAVITFIPHPLFILKGIKNYLICTYDDRRKYLQDMGIDYLVEIPFNIEFSKIEPDKFLDNYIIKSKKIKEFFVGYDFAFGFNRTGDQDFIREFCNEKGIVFNLQEKNEMDNMMISSTNIREFLKKGDINQVNKLLNRKYTISGVSTKGKQQGKKLGFPTINLDYSDDIILPKNGVYVTNLYYNNKKYLSLTNIGIRPTFNDYDRLSLETHVIDFNYNTYGEEMTISFDSFLRDEKKFNDSNELFNQIKFDIKRRKEL